MNQTTIDIRLPCITGRTEKEQLQEIKSYLYQTAQQLQAALDQLGEGQTRTVRGQAAAAAAEQSAMGPKGTFNAIKSLIIKSAEIVDAYYEQISRRLEGLYVAQSDFGTYSEQTSQQITENSRQIERLFSNVQTVDMKLGGVQGNLSGLEDAVEGVRDALGSVDAGMETLRSAIIRTSAYLKSGLLCYGEDGAPVYGLEIGQTNTVDGTEVFEKFARFSADRLSFYDRNDTEVAYISDYKLFITHAQVTGTLTVGRYELDTSDGLLFRWAGE